MSNLVGRLALLVASALVLSLVPGSIQEASGASVELVRGVYGRDSSPNGTSLLSDAGFNTVTVGPSVAELDQLQAAGMKGVVWLGSYNRGAQEGECQFERDDAWIRNTIPAIAGHPAIAAYQVTDEPNKQTCPNSPAHMKARSDLIKSLDSSKPTYLVVSTWDGVEGYPYQYFAGKADIMGLDVYPCTYDHGCRFSKIDEAITEASNDGVTRYWAIIQDFSDSWYRSPTAAELQTQFDYWGESGMEGYFVYHWNVGDVEDKADHVSVLAAVNLVVPVPPTPQPPSTDPSQGRDAGRKPSAPRHLGWKTRGAAKVKLTWKRPRNGPVKKFKVYKGDKLISKTRSLSTKARFHKVGRHVLKVRAYGYGGQRSKKVKTVVYFCRGHWKAQHPEYCGKLVRSQR